MISKKEAYRIVYNDLTAEDNTSLFRGNYDAVNGSEDFMHGISTVIENIAFHVDDSTLYNFSKMFTNNMIKSKEIAKRKLYRKSLKYRILKKLGRDTIKVNK